MSSHLIIFTVFNPPMVWPFKIFQNLLTGKMAINISEPFKTHLSIPFERIWKVEKLGYGIPYDNLWKPFSLANLKGFQRSDNYMANALYIRGLKGLYTIGKNVYKFMHPYFKQIV